VYRFLEAAAVERGFDYRLVDYRGFGHAPDFGAGLSLHAATGLALDHIEAAPVDSILFCRSFGCDVGLYLAARNDSIFTRFARIVLWGPSSYHYCWTLIGQSSHAIGAFNAGAASKGLQLGDDFWTSFVPIEESASAYRGKMLTIGYGSKDPICSDAFVSYLSSLVQKDNEDCKIAIDKIEGAAHEIKPNADPAILKAYLELIFGS
jgi:pimeloyl-ACP methyl ester carboxylesterase